MLKVYFNLFGRKKYFIYFNLICYMFDSFKKSFGIVIIPHLLTKNNAQVQRVKCTGYQLLVLTGL